MNNLNNLKAESRLLVYTFLLLWTIPLLVGGLEPQSLIAHDEGLYATRARLMLLTEDWVNPWRTPHYKTPGIYWLIACSYRLFGLNETAVRIPSVIFSLIAVVLVYEIGRLTINHYVGFLAAAILNLQFLWLQYSRLGNPDLPTIVLILLAIWALLRAEAAEFNPNLWRGLAGFCLGLGVLFRGFLMGVPLLALTPYLILANRRHRHLNSIWLYLGFVLGLVPLLIWLYLSWTRYGMETFTALLGLVVNLGTDNRNDQSIFFYLLSLATSPFPWGIIACSGGYIAYRNRLQGGRSLILGFPLVVFILISIYSTRLNHYALTLYPFLALLAALGLSALLNPQKYKYPLPNWVLPTIIYGFALLGALLLIVALVLIFAVQSQQQYAAIAIPLGLAWLFMGWLGYKQYPIYLVVAWLLIGNWLGLLTAVNIGAIGNYSPDIKNFVNQAQIAQILQREPTYIISGGDKVSVLLKFYLPNWQPKVNKLPIPACSYAFSKSEDLQSFTTPYQSLGTIRDWEFIRLTNCSN